MNMNNKLQCFSFHFNQPITSTSSAINIDKLSDSQPTKADFRLSLNKIEYIFLLLLMVIIVIKD